MALMRNKCPKETRFFFFLEKSSNSFLSFGDYHLAESYAIHTPLPYRLYYGNLRGKRQFKIEVDGNIIESFDVYYSVKVILFGVFFFVRFFLLLMKRIYGFFHNRITNALTPHQVHTLKIDQYAI